MILCWLGLHRWQGWIAHTGQPLMPSWFICRKVCLRCGEDRTDWPLSELWDRGWRP